MLESQSSTEKTQIIAYFSIKTWVKKFLLAVGIQGHVTLASKAYSYPTYGVTHKKTKIQNLAIFFIAI